MKKILSLNVNGNNYEVAINPWQTLLDVLRNELGLIGTKKGCDIGTCGVCTVIMDGKAILSCLTLAIECEGHTISTIEGISTAESLHPVQKSFIENGAVQCGFCTPGMILKAYSLLRGNPQPTREEIIQGMDDNLCRCGSHIRIVEAIQTAAREMKGGHEI